MNRMPLLGWRNWNIVEGSHLYGFYDNHWRGPEYQAACRYCDLTPRRNCRCGIYSVHSQRVALKWKWGLQDPVYVLSPFALGFGCTLPGLIQFPHIWGNNIMAMISSMILFPLLVGLFMALVFFPIFQGEGFIIPKVLGLVALTGTIHHYDMGMRAERARIVCFRLPLFWGRKSIKRWARLNNVPVFEIWQHKKMIAYALEHGQFLSQLQSEELK